MVRESCSHISRVRNFKNKTQKDKTWVKHCVEKEFRRVGKGGGQDMAVTGRPDPRQSGAPSHSAA